MQILIESTALNEVELLQRQIIKRVKKEKNVQ